jgi:class 3 adenylate cyclase
MSATEIVVLFLTDVEGSSRLWQAHPERMGEVIDGLDEIVLAAVTAHGGTLLKSRGEGDSHFVCFSLASRALRAAAELQRRLGAKLWPDGIELKLRVALHAGEVQRRELDYSGIAVNRAARVRSAAHGGQILATRCVAELAGDEPGFELRLVSLGSYRVRDMPGWTELFQVWAPGLARQFPSPLTLDAGCRQWRQSCSSTSTTQCAPPSA